MSVLATQSHDAPATPTGKDASQQNLPLPKRKAFMHAIPILTEDEISVLAEAIPEYGLGVRKNYRHGTINALH
jgi:hypothetical protein